MDWCLELLLWNYSGSGDVGEQSTYMLEEGMSPVNTYKTSASEISQEPWTSEAEMTECSSVAISEYDKIDCQCKDVDNYVISSENKQPAPCTSSNDGSRCPSQPRIFCEDNKSNGNGEICIGLKYNHVYDALDVTIIKCVNLPAADARNQTANPYVKTYLLMSKRFLGKRKTKVVNDSRTPTFYEIFRYSVPRDDLKLFRLFVAVWHHNRPKRNFCLGELTIVLEDFRFGSPLTRWYSLQQREKNDNSCWKL